MLALYKCKPFAIFLQTAATPGGLSLQPPSCRGRSQTTEGHNDNKSLILSPLSVFIIFILSQYIRYVFCNSKAKFKQIPPEQHKETVDRNNSPTPVPTSGLTQSKKYTLASRSTHTLDCNMKKLSNHVVKISLCCWREKITSQIGYLYTSPKIRLTNIL